MAARSGVRRAAGAVGGDAGSDPLEGARKAAADLRWLDVFETLSACDRGAGLAAEDLELLATAAFLLGRGQECRQARLWAYQLYLHKGKVGRAARCAARIGLEQLGAGDAAAAAAAAGQAVALGRRFGDADLLALALTVQGRALVRSARVSDGVAALDEAVALVVAGEVSPQVAGLALSAAVDTGAEAFELARWDEWSQGLARWCERQQGLVAFRCRSLAPNKAAVERRHGRWDAALELAERACEPSIAGLDPMAAAAARYWFAAGGETLGAGAHVIELTCCDGDDQVVRLVVGEREPEPVDTVEGEDAGEPMVIVRFAGCRPSQRRSRCRPAVLSRRERRSGEGERACSCSCVPEHLRPVSHADA